MSAPKTSEAGFSLISVLVIMGVVLLSILLISQAKFRQQGTQKALKIKQSYTDVNQSLVNDVVARFHKDLGGTGCFDLNSFNASGGAPLIQGTRYTFAQTIQNFSASAPQLHRDASTRCRAPQKPANNASGNRFYFCTQLTRDTSAPTDSILNSKVAFAEFAIELIDLQTQQPITCDQYKTKRDDPKDGSAGMAVTMALYWENQSGAQNTTTGTNGSTFSQKALSYIANQN